MWRGSNAFPVRSCGSKSRRRGTFRNTLHCFLSLPLVSTYCTFPDTYMYWLELWERLRSNCVSLWILTNRIWLPNCLLSFYFLKVADGCFPHRFILNLRYVFTRTYFLLVWLQRCRRKPAIDESYCIKRLDYGSLGLWISGFKL